MANARSGPSPRPRAHRPRGLEQLDTGSGPDRNEPQSSNWSPSTATVECARVPRNQSRSGPVSYVKVPGSTTRSAVDPELERQRVRVGVCRQERRRRRPAVEHEPELLSAGRHIRSRRTPRVPLRGSGKREGRRQVEAPVVEERGRAVRPRKCRRESPHGVEHTAGTDPLPRPRLRSGRGGRQGDTPDCARSDHRRGALAPASSRSRIPPAPVRRAAPPERRSAERERACVRGSDDCRGCRPRRFARGAGAASRGFRRPCSVDELRKQLAAAIQLPARVEIVYGCHASLCPGRIAVDPGRGAARAPGRSPSRASPARLHRTDRGSDVAARFLT